MKWVLNKVRQTLRMTVRSKMSQEVVAMEPKSEASEEERKETMDMREKQIQVLVMLMHESEAVRRNLGRLWLVNGELVIGLVAVGYLPWRK